MMTSQIIKAVKKAIKRKPLNRGDLVRNIRYQGVDKIVNWLYITGQIEMNPKGEYVTK